MIHKIKMLFLILAVTVVSSCELDLLDNPNAVTVNNADINYLLNSVATGYAGNFNAFSDPGMRLTRMLNQGSVIYDNAVSPGSSDGRWSSSYSGVLADVSATITIARTTLEIPACTNNSPFSAMDIVAATSASTPA